MKSAFERSFFPGRDSNVPNWVGIASIGEEIYLAGQNGGVSSFFYKNDVEDPFIPEHTIVTSIKAIDSDIYMSAYRRDSAVSMNSIELGYYRNKTFIDVIHTPLSDIQGNPDLSLLDMDKAGDDIYMVGDISIAGNNSTTPVYVKNGVLSKLPGKGEARVIAVRRKT